jgi:hypothetical protein
LIYSGWVNDSGDDGSMFLAISPFAGSMFVVIYISPSPKRRSRDKLGKGIKGMGHSLAK